MAAASYGAVPKLDTSSGSVPPPGSTPPRQTAPANAIPTLDTPSENPYDKLPAYAFTGKGPGREGRLIKFSVAWGATPFPKSPVQWALLNDGDSGNAWIVAVTGYDWDQLVNGNGDPLNTTAFYGQARAAWFDVANRIRALNGWERLRTDDLVDAENDTATVEFADESDVNNVQTPWKGGIDLIFPPKDFPVNLYPNVDAPPRVIPWDAKKGVIRFVPIKLNVLKDDAGNVQWAGVMYMVCDGWSRTAYLKQSVYPVAIKSQLNSSVSGGASLGAAIGTAIFPLVGTLVGAIIGAIGGLFVGLGLNSDALNKAIKQLSATEPTVAQKLVDTAGVGQGAQPGVPPKAPPSEGSNTTLYLVAAGLLLAALALD